MKFNIIFHNILEPIYFVISKIYSELKLKNNYSLLKKSIFKKKIYIIAAGSSLDNFVFKGIDNSVFVLINGTIELIKKIPKNNIIYWSAIDVVKINHFINKVPNNISCIISCSKYRAILSILFSKKNIIYFHPKIGLICKKFSFFLFAFIRNIYFPAPKILKSIADIREQLNITKNNAVVLPNNPVLFLLIIFIKLKPKNINLVGFDMGSKNGNSYSNIKYYKDKVFISSTIKGTLDIFKKILLILKKKKIKFRNYSKS